MSLNHVAEVVVQSAGLYREPSASAPLETEVLFGERVRVLEVGTADWVQVTTKLDAYTGYLRAKYLLPADMRSPTHLVSVAQMALYREPNFKSASTEDIVLPMNARVSVFETAETPEGLMFDVSGLGWAFVDQVRPIDAYVPDFVAEASKLLGTAYRWGSRSRGFVDCSSLVQAGCIAAGIPCPRDVSQQVGTLGEAISFASDFSNLLRGDLVFWTHKKGRHVAIMIDTTNVLHATIAPPHRGAVIQPLQNVIADQARDGNGPVTAVRRFPDYEPA